MTRHITTMTIDDVEHYSAEQKAAIVASYPTHEREARAKGVPAMGSGAIFPIEESRIICDPVPILRHWKRIIGIDFGFDHPFAAVSLALDADYDRIYVTHEFRQSQTTPVIHAAAVRPWGEWIPCAWPHDGLQHDKGSGDQLAALYRAQHLNMLPERATHDDGGNGVEAGIAEILDMMQTDRFKIFNTMTKLREEIRLYHRKKMADGSSKIVKEMDDLVSAMRYAVMMRRYAKVKPGFTTERRSARVGTIA